MRDRHELQHVGPDTAGIGVVELAEGEEELEHEDEGAEDLYGLSAGAGLAAGGLITSDGKAIGKKSWGALPSAFGEGDEEDENTRTNNNTNTTKKKKTTKSSYFFSTKTSTKKARERC